MPHTAGAVQAVKERRMQEFPDSGRSAFGAPAHHKEAAPGDGLQAGTGFKSRLLESKWTSKWPGHWK